MQPNLMLNLDEFVRITQTTGADIEGVYDNVVYLFPDGKPVDVHKAVAVHIFGFGLPEKSDDAKILDKTPCLLRLNWVQASGDIKSGLETLRRCVRFEEIPPFPTLLRLRQPEENSGLPQMDLPESPSHAGALVKGGAGGTGAVTAAPVEPKKTGTK